MKRTRQSPEQIVAKRHQAATEWAGGRRIEEVCKTLTIGPATCHRWQGQYGGAEVNTVKELKALKEENPKLKKPVADLSLDKVALKELLEGKWQARRASERQWDISSAHRR